MTSDEITLLNKRLLDIIACTNQSIKRSRLLAFKADLETINSPFVNWLQSEIEYELEGLA